MTKNVTRWEGASTFALALVALPPPPSGSPYASVSPLAGSEPSAGMLPPILPGAPSYPPSPAGAPPHAQAGVAQHQRVSRGFKDARSYLGIRLTWGGLDAAPSASRPGRPTACTASVVRRPSVSSVPPGTPPPGTPGSDELLARPSPARLGSSCTTLPDAASRAKPHVVPSALASLDGAPVRSCPSPAISVCS